MARSVICVLLLVFAPGVALTIVGLVQSAAASAPWLWSVGIGTALGVIIDQFLLRKVRGLEVFEHELTHAIAALMFFRRVNRFVVTRYDGGYVEHSGSNGGIIGDDFIGFAPYVFPTFTFFSVLVRPWLGAEFFPWFDIWIGFTFGFHTWSTIRETSGAWHHRTFRRARGSEYMRSDLGKRGLLYSAIYISITTVAIHGFILSIMLFGYRGVVVWGTQVWQTTWVFLLAFYEYGMALRAKILNGALIWIPFS